MPLFPAQGAHDAPVAVFAGKVPGIRTGYEGVHRPGLLSLARSLSEDMATYAANGVIPEAAHYARLGLVLIELRQREPEFEFASWPATVSG